MGSGKTTLAKKLAKKLDYTWFDLDQEIEIKEKLTVAQIFEEKGDECFRELEAETLKSMIENNTQFVLSVGGGTPCYYDNIKIMNGAGTTIYLKYNEGILSSRLINAKVKRPLIKGLNEIQLQEFIKAKLVERESFYKQSKFTIAGDNLKVEDLLRLLQ